MVNTIDLISVLEKFAPLSTAQEWDNSGWQINLNLPEVNKVMLALSVTEDVIDQAIKEKCDFILSHHPIFFSTVKKIEDQIVIKAIQNNIQIYSSHTNLDIAVGGTSDIVLKKLGYNNIKAHNDFIRYVELDSSKDLNSFITCVKDKLGIPNIRLINPNNILNVNSIAVCAGSGGSFISELKNSKIELYITGDVKYHEALSADNIIVLDNGHYGSEKFVSDIFKEVLKEISVELVVADEKDIWQVV